MPRYDLDPELLGRLAERLEETGRALKTVIAQQVDLQSSVSSIKTQLESVHARIKAIEKKLDGDEVSQGMRTQLELLKSDLDRAMSLASSIESWRTGLSEQKVAELKAEKREDKNKSRNTILAIITILIALASTLANCGPQWIKAWQDDDQEQVAE